LALENGGDGAHGGLSAPSTPSGIKRIFSCGGHYYKEGRVTSSIAAMPALIALI